MAIIQPPGPSLAAFRRVERISKKPKLGAARWGVGVANLLQSDGTQVSFAQRLELRTGAGSGWTDFEFIFANYGIDNDDAPNDITIKLAFEFAQIAPIWWQAGGRSKTLVPGETARTQPVSIYIPEDRSFWLRYWVTVPAAGKWPRAVTQLLSATQSMSPGTDITDAGTFDGVATVNAALTPISVLARPVSAMVSIGLLGDSIMTGSGETTSEKYARGFGMRACEALKLPWTHTAQGGYSLSSLNSFGERRRWFQAHEGTTHMLCNFGTNDINGARTLEQIQTDYAGINEHVTSIGAKLIPCTLMPRTNAANNAAFASDTAGMISTKAAYDAWIRTNPFGNGYVDLLSVTQASGNPLRWRSDLGTPTVDGIHPASVVHIAAAAEVAAAFPALLT